MVMTLHDFKLISPNYTLSNHGKIWEKSKPKKYFNCVLDKCVKNSYSKSLVCAIEAYLHNFLGTYGKIDLFLSPSHFLIDKFKEFVFSGKIVYLRNPLIIQSDIPLRTASADSLKTILYFGRLSHEKGLYLLFQAFSDYLQTSSAQNVILTLAGDGAEKVFLIALAERLRIADKIRFLGQLDYAGLEREKAAADFIILPSTWYENAPYAVLETMAAGKVILASNIGGLPELVSDGKTGFLFIAGNQADLARQISFVINLSLPEKQAIGLRAKDFIATAYSSEKYYVDLMDIYTEILKNHSQSVKE
jgi:glycosyltransferase involved in cell wall biosynthesis